MKFKFKYFDLRCEIWNTNENYGGKKMDMKGICSKDMIFN